MAGETENLVLEHLRKLREGQDALLADSREAKSRFTTIDENLALMRADIAQLHSMYAGMNRRLDRMDDRLSRIERRLDLVEEPHT